MQLPHSAEELFHVNIVGLRRQHSPAIIPPGCLGLEQNRLWFLHNGRNERLTDVGDNVIPEMIT